jgi:ubiquinone/menaquinone biosynthesis C-methylase UbiE
VTRQEHWDSIYASKGEQDVSWFEASPATSLRLIKDAGLSPETCVLDVGGGESRLVDALVAEGVKCIAVLDISGASLRHAQQRLGPAAAAITWIDADVTAEWSLPLMDIWHDRAVFHFLTMAEDRRRYVEHLRNVLKPGGTAVIATFALDGPEKCSGLPVVRYSSATLAAELGREFQLVDSVAHDHRTPWGATQSFQCSRFAFRP